MLHTSGSISSFFTLKINQWRSFTNTVSGRSNIDGLVDHFDFVDMDVFSVHELDDVMAVLGAGGSNRASILVANEYHHWSKRMERYLRRLRGDVWRSVEEGPHAIFLLQFRMMALKLDREEVSLP
ncbi:unnamed protein product [Lactuca saligna]|uniref:Uncharacterized protein n=1 Tax=Lactuca saligna TaxID=75948 RepID=A0AA36EEQ9_LACSI|nr:unnamed protein product [Lactuca saligna]